MVGCTLVHWLVYTTYQWLVVHWSIGWCTSGPVWTRGPVEYPGYAVYRVRSTLTVARYQTMSGTGTPWQPCPAATVSSSATPRPEPRKKGAHQARLRIAARIATPLRGYSGHSVVKQGNKRPVPE